MANGRHKYFIAIFVLHSFTNTIYAENDIDERRNDSNGEARALFSPRVDYNEWMPVGRGDPLKNDPTYDYSPPVLDRVQYWGNSNKSKEKKEVLLLGVTSKRSYKKEPKHNTIMRRNFYSHLPTRLMPPPMQTISPSTKHSSTENYHGAYYNNHYNMPSQTWSSHNSINYGDSNVEGSMNYISVSRPNKNNIRNEYMAQHTPPSRRPWLHALLEKEVTKPTPLYVMQPSKSIFESHPPPSLEPIATFPPATTTTVPSMIYTTSEMPLFQPTVPPVITPTTMDTLITGHSQPQTIVPRPMYLIIEGHSKVKTYGQNDTLPGKVHAPKIVPIQAAEESIIKHVVSENEKGQAMEVMHLHKGHHEPQSIPTTASPPSAMGDLLSLLDTSLGNFFLGDESSTEKPKIEDKSKENSSDKPKIEDKPEEVTEVGKKKEEPKISEEADKLERESRQIFDYDNLPEAALREEDEIVDEDFRISLEPKSGHASAYDDIDYSSTEIL